MPVLAHAADGGGVEGVAVAEPVEPEEVEEGGDRQDQTDAERLPWADIAENGTGTVPGPRPRLPRGARPRRRERRVDGDGARHPGRRAGRRAGHFTLPRSCAIMVVGSISSPKTPPGLSTSQTWSISSVCSRKAVLGGHLPPAVIDGAEAISRDNIGR
ncbi:MAG: hypothetical protein HY332_03630 [Chloroflexi bacterium]|nr:hypothetical protein [Chloroflexota bacterium]